MTLVSDISVILPYLSLNGALIKDVQLVHPFLLGGLYGDKEVGGIRVEGCCAPGSVVGAGLDHSDSFVHLSPSTKFALGQYILDSLH